MASSLELDRPGGHGRRRVLLLLPAVSLLGACAALAGDPPRVTLVDLESLPGEGLEWRALMRLRVQNPGSAEIRFEGIAVELELRGLSFASGVAPVAGVLAPFSEGVVGVPISVSGLGVARQVLDLARELSRSEGGVKTLPKLPYTLRGRLGGFAGPRFESSGVLELPDFFARP